MAAACLTPCPARLRRGANWAERNWNRVTSQEPFDCGIGALCGGLGASTLAVVRVYWGWACVGNRLFSAIVEHEETGW